MINVAFQISNTSKKSTLNITQIYIFFYEIYISAMASIFIHLKKIALFYNIISPLIIQTNDFVNI